jgi:hypothetical protein
MGNPVKKYKFRKMFFICDDRKVIDSNVHSITIYQYKEYADTILKEKGQRENHKMWDDKTKPLPIKTVEGFYLVPEKLFDEILKDWVKE